MQTFNQFASKNIRIDQDASGLFALVPDASGKWMRVQCVESKKSVHASHCSCHTFSKKQHCNHVELVQAYYDKIYKVTPMVAEVAPVSVTDAAPKVVKARKPRNGLVRKVRNGGLVKVAQPKVSVAKIIELPTKVTDISQKGNFGTKAFSLMR